MGRLIQTTYVAALVSCFYLPNANAAQIQVYPGNAEQPALISLTGEIVAGDESRFSTIAATNPSAILVLNSSGGALGPAIEIGKVTKLRGYSTVVYKDSVCASACALIWLAGLHRVIFGNGKVGFHASYKDEGGKLVETGLGNAVVGHYLAQLGYSEAAVIFATSAPPDKIVWLNAANGPASGIEYEVRDADQTSGPVVAAQSESAPADDVFTNGNVYVDSYPTLVRNVRAFVEGLKQNSYQASLDTSTPSSPRILTGSSGYKLVIAFSSCSGLDCNYAELIAIWEGVDPDQANEAVRKYALDENFANVVYDKDGKNLSVYHYIILGHDGITVNNLIENIEYFVKDFQKVANILTEQK